ncbi:MAG: hypothetical protein ABMB14_07700 [Myxococcota bacterium]
MRNILMAIPVVLVGCVLDGPNKDELTPAEAKTAIESLNQTARSDNASAAIVDVTTDVTVGDPLSAIIGGVSDFWESQAPCTAVSVGGDTLTLDFGSLADDCTFAGHTYAGIDTVAFTAVDPGTMKVMHTFDAFTNGNVTIDGTTDVTWTGDDDWTRHVESDYVFANFVDPTLVEVHSEHTVSRLDPAVPIRDGGFVLSGTRDWTVDDHNDWSMTMNDLKLMIDDAAPFAGTAEVVTPDDRNLSIVYDRLDDGTITATVTGEGGNKSLVFYIDQDGVVNDQ